jgi:ABC-type anion transport system duplicated permease subunit
LGWHWQVAAFEPPDLSPDLPVVSNPKVVFVPVVILFLGIGDTAKITIMFLILFFQIVVLVRDQAAGLPPQLMQSLRSLGAGRRALFRFVYLPASLPAILTALRQSIGTAVAVLYITELSATKYGLGYYIYYNGGTAGLSRHARDCHEPAWLMHLQDWLERNGARKFVIDIFA